MIVPVRNDALNLGKCLRALALSRGVEFEVIVVDDKSTDDTFEVARQSGYRAIALPKQAGPGDARNAGASLANGNIFVFIDADVCVTPNTLRHFADEFLKTPDAAAIFGSYDTAQEAPGFVTTFKNLKHHYLHQNSSPEADTFWTGCGAVRRDTFTQLDGFRSDLSAFKMEDVEFGMRVRKAGQRIRLCPEIQVTHLKQWTLLNLIRTDVLSRALPWTRLMLTNRKIGSTLNLATAQKASAAAAAAGLAAMLIGALQNLPALFAVAAALWLAIVPLNAGYYAFLFRERGLGFALGAFPLHLLYFLYSSFGFGAGVFLYAGERLRAVRGSEGLAFFFVVFGYWYFANNGKLPTPFQGADGSYYANQAEGYWRGQLAMTETPDPRLLALKDPYEWAQRGDIPVLWDASFFKGKYFLYFSSVPIVLLYLPMRLLLGAYPTDAAACVLFCLASLLVCLHLIGKVSRRTEGTPLPRWAWILLLGVGNGIPVALTAPNLYPVAITCALFFSCALLSALFDLLVTRDESKATLVRMGTFAVLTFACRPSLFPLAGMLGLAAVYHCRRNARRWLRLLTLAGAPLLIGFALLAAFNYARFGRPKEFGIRYQISTANLGATPIPASWKRALRGFRIYLFAPPRFSAHFPFINVPHVKIFPGDEFLRINPERVVGLVPTSLLFLLAPIAALILLLAQYRRKLNESETAVAWFAAIALTGGFLILSFLATCPLATNRYQLDFLPYFTVAAVCFVLTAYRFVPIKHPRLLTALVLIFCIPSFLLVYSMRRTSEAKAPLQRPFPLVLRLCFLLFFAFPQNAAHARPNFSCGGKWPVLWGTKTTFDDSKKTATEPFDRDLIAANDPILMHEEDYGVFSGRMKLPNTGRPLYPEVANQKFKEFLNRDPYLREHFNDSVLFTGSTSASLFWATPYGANSGGLLPPSHFTAKTGGVVYVGTMDNGSVSVNKEHVSAVYMWNIRTALTYSKKDQWYNQVARFGWDSKKIEGWSPQSGQKKVQQLKAQIKEGDFGASYRPQLDLRLALEENRLKEFEKLSPFEKELVTNPFPVLYGFRPARTDVVTRVTTASDEVGVRNGIPTSEMRTIFVPKEKIALVDGLLKAKNITHIHVADIEGLFRPVPSP